MGSLMLAVGLLAYLLVLYFTAGLFLLSFDSKVGDSMTEAVLWVLSITVFLNIIASAIFVKGLYTITHRPITTGSFIKNILVLTIVVDLLTYLLLLRLG